MLLVRVLGSRSEGVLLRVPPGVAWLMVPACAAAAPAAWEPGSAVEVAGRWAGPLVRNHCGLSQPDGLAHPSRLLSGGSSLPEARSLMSGVQRAVRLRSKLGTAHSKNSEGVASGPQQRRPPGTAELISSMVLRPDRLRGCPEHGLPLACPHSRPGPAPRRQSLRQQRPTRRRVSAAVRPGYSPAEALPSPTLGRPDAAAAGRCAPEAGPGAAGEGWRGPAADLPGHSQDAGEVRGAAQASAGPGPSSRTHALTRAQAQGVGELIAYWTLESSEDALEELEETLIVRCRCVLPPLRAAAGPTTWAWR